MDIIQLCRRFYAENTKYFENKASANNQSMITRK